MDNPFSLSFGTIPRNYIERPSDVNTIIDEFSSTFPSNYVRIITGIRGSGKTVLLTEIGKLFQQNKDWIVVEVNPETEIMDDLVSKLYNLENIKPLFANISFNIGFSGSGILVANNPINPSSDVIIEKMLEIIQKRGKRLLVSMDEAVNNNFVKKFAHSFQILIRKGFPIFLVMTGLNENISNLQDNKSLTFLYRAPKTYLYSLNMNMISNVYKDVFSVDYDYAYKMALLTQGYPFAFQVLGYLKWKNNEKNLDNLLHEYDYYLANFVYDKIWSELSEKSKQILMVFKDNKPLKVKEIREKLGSTSSQFSTSKKVLVDKGLLVESGYGYLKLALPRFSNFVENMIRWQ